MIDESASHISIEDKKKKEKKREEKIIEREKNEKIEI